MSPRQPAFRRPRIVEQRRIWDRAAHNAFTDLLRLGGVWYCAFREAGDHAEDVGAIRVLKSRDARRWSSAALLAQRGVDLRDPKLSATPNGRLMLLVGGTHHRGGKAVGRRSRVLFSTDGHVWTRPRSVLESGDWLWRATWCGGRVYGVTYRLTSGNRWDIHLASSPDGLHWSLLGRLAVPGKPNETTLRFETGGKAVALVRREGGDRSAWIGRALPPYQSWVWKSARHRVGGPNFLVLPNGCMWAAGRAYGKGTYRVAIARMSGGRYRPVLDLPSGGDCGYPGMVWHDGRLWVSYYSQHEGKCAVYLAVVELGC